MKKTLKALAIVAILLLALFALTGCDKSKNSNPIVGTWKYEQADYKYTFNEDGTGDYSFSSTKMEFTYKTEDGKLSITYNGSTAPFESEYSIDGDTLNIKDSLGRDTIYKKQK